MTRHSKWKYHKDQGNGNIQLFKKWQTNLFEMTCGWLHHHDLAPIKDFMTFESQWGDLDFGRVKSNNSVILEKNLSHIWNPRCQNWLDKMCRNILKLKSMVITSCSKKLLAGTSNQSAYTQSTCNIFVSVGICIVVCVCLCKCEGVCKHLSLLHPSKGTPGTEHAWTEQVWPWTTTTQQDDTLLLTSNQHHWGSWWQQAWPGHHSHCAFLGQSQCQG